MLTVWWYQSETFSLSAARREDHYIGITFLWCVIQWCLTLCPFTSSVLHMGWWPPLQNSDLSKPCLSYFPFACRSTVHDSVACKQSHSLCKQACEGGGMEIVLCLSNLPKVTGLVQGIRMVYRFHIQCFSCSKRDHLDLIPIHWNLYVGTFLSWRSSLRETLPCLPRDLSFYFEVPAPLVSIICRLQIITQFLMYHPDTDVYREYKWVLISANIKHLPLDTFSGVSISSLYL